jgi:hypothetical protein
MVVEKRTMFNMGRCVNLVLNIEHRGFFSGG